MAVVIGKEWTQLMQKKPGTWEGEVRQAPERVMQAAHERRIGGGKSEGKVRDNEKSEVEARQTLFAITL